MKRVLKPFQALSHINCIRLQSSLVDFRAEIFTGHLLLNFNGAAYPLTLRNEFLYSAHLKSILQSIGIYFHISDKLARMFC